MEGLSSIMFSELYREIFLRKTNDDWNEITLNTGGVASTLQDIKDHHRSGGHVFQKNPNRFIFWRSEHNVLELVEESLDLNLHGNQIRCKFTDSPVLEGISITEVFDRVVILVPTVSSLHRFTFPHPDKQLRKGYSEPTSHSIFHGFGEAEATDPANYYVLESTSGGIVCGASYLAPNYDAVFALSLTNMSILLIRMGDGDVITSVLTQDSIVPRFLSGITEALMRKEWHDNIAVSLVLHFMDDRLCLFSLDRCGELRAWCCETGVLLSSTKIKSYSRSTKANSNKHKMIKGFHDNSFALYCCLQGCSLVAVCPISNQNSFKFFIVSQFSTVLGLELVEMCSGEENDIWCIWLTGEENPLITRIDMNRPLSWMTVSLSQPPLKVNTSKFIHIDPVRLYLNSIFTSGYFTPSDVVKALSIYKTNAIVKPNVDIQIQVASIVEAEVFSDIGEQEIDDDEFLEISHRSWSRLYSCCTQFFMSGQLPVGMVWLGGSNLVLIQETGFSLVGQMDNVELFWKTKVSHSQYPEVPFGSLLELTRDIKLDEGLDRLDLALLLGEPLLQKNLENATELVLDYQKITLFNLEGLNHEFNELIKLLFMPKLFERDVTNLGVFCSNRGVSAVTSAFRDFCYTRLNICKQLFLICQLHCLKIPWIVSHQQALAELCRGYYVLYWTCITNEPSGLPIVHSYISSLQGQLMENTLEMSILSVAAALWPHENNESLAQYLFTTKQYVYIQDLSRITNVITWKHLLAQSYMEIGEFEKGFNICVQGYNLDMAHYLKALRLFESYSRSDYAIKVASEAIANLDDITPEDLEILQSALFLHELLLKHYKAAYAWIENCPSWSRRCDSLHRLVATMINERHFCELVEFPFNGMVDILDTFLSTRARSLPAQQAAHYYNILYSFHIKHDNFKKAAAVMFEKALGSDNVEMQWRCLGDCLNCLNLVEKEHRWLPRPKYMASSTDVTVEILDIADIRSEYELAGARYNLGNCSPDAGPEEVVSLCITNREYRIALRIAKMCGVPFGPIIQSLTSACASIPDTKDWQWLRNNEIDDMIITEDNAEEMSWRVLRKFIEKYDGEHLTESHKACAQKLLEHGLFLPCWLISSYKKRNAHELLKLYFINGFLEEASELAYNYLNAGLGIGKEAFSIDAHLLPTSPPLWLPINTIDLLVKELKYHKMEEKVETALNKYVSEVLRLSKDKEQLLLT